MFVIDNARLIKLREQGLSYKQIAESLGISKGVVAGRLKRMADSKKIGPAPPKPPKTVPVKVAKVRTARVMQPNRYTIFTRPTNYVQPSKADLREQLHRAVLNTK